MKSFSDILISMSENKPVTVQFDWGYEFNFLPLKGELKEMVENTDDTPTRHSQAAIYGMAVGWVRAIDFGNLDELAIKESFKLKGMPNDMVSQLAEKVLEISGMDYLHPDDMKKQEEELRVDCPMGNIDGEPEELEDDMEEVSEETLYDPTQS